MFLVDLRLLIGNVFQPTADQIRLASLIDRGEIQTREIQEKLNKVSPRSLIECWVTFRRFMVSMITD